MTLKITGFVHLEGKASAAQPLPLCENCGHDIRNVFTVTDENGKSMRVGSECVLLLTARTETYTQASKIVARIKRASSQWNKNNPRKLEGETREQYINRRVSEMANALIAHKAWKVERAQLEAKWNGRQWVGKALRVADRCQRLGLHCTHTDVIKRHNERIARKYKANQFDYMRPTWDVAKL